MKNLRKLLNLLGCPVSPENGRFCAVPGTAVSGTAPGTALLKSLLFLGFRCPNNGDTGFFSPITIAVPTPIGGWGSEWGHRLVAA
jgi:hypothetical protein